jgi:hypothetical protein
MAQLSFGRASVRVVVDDSMELLGMLLMEFPGMYTSRGMVKEAALDWMRQSTNPETQGSGVGAGSPVVTGIPPMLVCEDHPDHEVDANAAHAVQLAATRKAGRLGCMSGTSTGHA